MWILLRGVRPLSAPAFSPTLHYEFSFFFFVLFVGAAVTQQSEVSSGKNEVSSLEVAPVCFTCISVSS